ncbi:MAG: hypothetical protein MZV64_00500 [Ignavibacteriales bacterium]|nr:hypothetical protein [Ignavibacteriales bacterium]
MGYLSAERKLDVVGDGHGAGGLAHDPDPVLAPQRSAMTSKLMLSISARRFGWGIYILPVALIVMGIVARPAPHRKTAAALARTRRRASSSCSYGCC